jgi:hypothetical protein
MSRIKEPHFFADNIRPPAQRVKDLASYEGLFASNKPVRGEASPSYACFAQHPGAPEHISKMVPQAKFIYLVRDPIARTMSHYVHRVAVENERRPLLEALGDVDEPANPYTCPSRYATQLERYLRYFPRERILIIDQRDLLVDRGRVLMDVFSFLGVDASFASSGFEEQRGASGDRRRFSRRYLRFSDRAGESPLRKLLPQRARRALRARLEGVMFPPVERPSMPPDLQRRLERLYAPEVERLRVLSALPLQTWTL